MSRVLVTGAAGFIGCHVARHLLASGHEVVAVDDLSGGFREHVPANARFVELDVSDAAGVARLFRDEGPFEHVYHLAAYAAEGLSHFIRRFNYTNNVVGSINLINEAVNHGVDCFVFTSSIAVYGSAPPPMTEDTTPQPEDPYGIAKYAVEMDLRAAHEQFGLDYVVFRPHNVYGEFQNIADRYRNVIGIFMNQIMNDAPMTIFGDGTQTRAFSHVNEVAPVIAAGPFASGARGEVFNVGADRPYSVSELAIAVAEAMQAEPEIEYLPARKEVLHAFSDHSKVRRVFDVPEAIPLDRGLFHMAKWARERGRMKPSGFAIDSVEVEKNFPEGWRAALGKALSVGS